MKLEHVRVLGMELERWTHASCVADFGVGDGWATLYSIRSTEPGQGHASWLLIWARVHYELLGKRFGGSVALNQRMRALYRRWGITEYR